MRRVASLPANLPSNPSYRKVNPADAPIMILALTSDTMIRPQMYDAADSILAQKIAQVEGVGQVFVGRWREAGGAGGTQSDSAEQLGVGLDQVRTALGGGQREPAEGRTGRTDQYVFDATDTDQTVQGRGVQAI